MLLSSHRSLNAAIACLATASIVACSDTGGEDDTAAFGAGGSATGSSGGSAAGGNSDTASSGGAAAPNSGGASDSGGTNSGGLGSVGGETGAGGAAGGTTDGSGGSAGGETGVGGSIGGETGVGGETGAGGSTGGAASTCPEATPLTGGMEICSNQRGDSGDGYAYELWAEGPGTSCMTVHGVDATFSASWTDVEDFLARAGLDFDQTQTHTEIGTISAEFAETKEDNGGLTYIGLYGWTVDPLREFYIMEDWGQEKPGGFSSDGTPRDEVGTLEIDGETYDVWKKTRENKPSIQGDTTFDQYFSIRRSARQCGTVSVSEHFSGWEDLGLPFGNLYEVKWLMEAQGNSGSISFTTATVVVE